MYAPHIISVLVFDPPMTRLGSVIEAAAGVLSRREYSTIRKRFSSVTTTMSFSALTAIELNAGYGSFRYRAGGRLIVPFRVRASYRVPEPAVIAPSCSA